MTTLRDAMVKAQVQTEAAWLAVLAYEVLKGRSPATATDRFVDHVLADSALLLELMEIKRAAVVHRATTYLRERAADMARDPDRACLEGGESHATHDRPVEPNQGSHAGDESQQSFDPLAAEPSAAPSQSVDESHSTVDRRGGRAKQPAASTKISAAAAVAVAEEVTKTVMDTFAIIDRNGQRLPVGDILVSSYERLIKMTRKRTWTASREHAMLTLLKSQVERSAAFVPEDARTRDILDARTVEGLLEMATRLALPQRQAAAA